MNFDQNDQHEKMKPAIGYCVKPEPLEKTDIFRVKSAKLG
jgi:hypothetical protein